MRRFLGVVIAIIFLGCGGLCCLESVAIIATGQNKDFIVGAGLMGGGGLLLIVVSGAYLGLFKQATNKSTQASVAPHEAHYARLDTLEKIRQLEPVAFENFVKDLFVRMGYTVETTKISGDEGIDLRLAKGTRRAIVQCKRYMHSVGQPTVRDLYGVLVHEQAHEAYLVTTGSITLPAQAWAKGKPIQLVDGVQLLEWVSSFGIQ